MISNNNKLQLKNEILKLELESANRYLTRAAYDVDIVAIRQLLKEINDKLVDYQLYGRRFDDGEQTNPRRQS